MTTNMQINIVNSEKCLLASWHAKGTMTFNVAKLKELPEDMAADEINRTAKLALSETMLTFD